jgi:hypothetical protein
MVVRNGRFTSPRGYSREHEKRLVDRLVAEDLTQETADNARLVRGVESGPEGHVVLDLLPRVTPHPAIDLHAAAHGVERTGRLTAAGRELLQQVRGLLQRSGRRLWQAFAPFGGRTLRAAQRQGRRLLDWISWK